MQRIGVREARQNLSVYLERVKHGETFTVTEHGRPVAMLVPLPRDDDPLAELIAAGKVSPPLRPFAPLPEPVQLPEDGPTLSEILRQMRDEERY